MEAIEEKLSAILGNPQLMGQIMSMAQSLGQSAPPPQQKESETQKPEPQQMPDIDPVLIGKIMNLAGSSKIDCNQKALLCALEPYLSRQRLLKLEKAMRCARLANAVSSILPNGAIPFLSGR